MHSLRGKSQGLRFYAVADVDPLAHAKLDGDHTRLVTFRDLAAIVAPAPYVRAEPTPAELADYRTVIDAAAKLGPVIPAPPGTVFRSEDVLSRWLEIHYAKLHETLGAIERRGEPGAPYDYVRMDLGV